MTLPGTELAWGAACTYVLCFDESLHSLVCFRTGKGDGGVTLIFSFTLILRLTSILMVLFVWVPSGKRRRPLKRLGSTAHMGQTSSVAGEMWLNFRDSGRLGSS